MRIALLHFHLKHGGVTSVIRHQVEAIRSMGGKPMVLVGEPCREAFPCEVHVIQGLAYDRFLSSDLTQQEISDSIIHAIGQKWPQGAHLLHVHNPTLAKNRYLQGVLRNLQRHGMSILCQIHDFAEDGRPGSYDKAPYLHDCHYAVVNPRDHRLLLAAGLRRHGCHLLPNTISIYPSVSQEIRDPKGVLYPVRAIRRKNIGEAILQSLYFRDNGPLVITLPPNSPLDLKCHRRWIAFSRQYRLPVQFDAGVDADFDLLLARCRFVITTSMTEGFGFAFLEAWAAGKALWGRMLPDICQGFVEHGVRFDWLYTRLRVPLSWVDRDKFKSRWICAMAGAHRRFDLSFAAEQLETAWQAVTTDDLIDFGMLDEYFQEQLIVKVLGAKSLRLRLVEINPFLERPQPPADARNIVTLNQQAIENHYRPLSYARRLGAIYRRVAQDDVRQELNKSILARSFLSPHEFSLLKWAPPQWREQ